MKIASSFRFFFIFLVILSLSVSLSAEEESPVPQLIMDGKGKPRLHLYDGEETAILSKNTSKTLVTKADGNFTRILYDDEYRLQSRLIWKEGDTSLGDEKAFFTPSELTSQEDYFYYDNSRNRQKIVLTDFKELSRKESFYSLEGLLVKEELYNFVPSEEDKKSQEKEDKSSEEKKSSNEEKIASKENKKTKSDNGNLNPENETQMENQELQEDGVVDEEELVPKDLPLNPWEGFPSLTLVQVIEYQYNQDKSLTEKKITQYNEDEKFIQKTVYHSPGNLYGGFDYFENEQLLISRKYEDESRYTETRYFDTMKIEVLYSGSRLLAEVVYLDGKELRRTEY